VLFAPCWCGAQGLLHHSRAAGSGGADFAQRQTAHARFWCEVRRIRAGRGTGRTAVRCAPYTRALFGVRKSLHEKSAARRARSRS